MSRSIKAIINNELLKWARERSGFSISIAALKLKIPEEKLSSWENGELNPTLSQLRKIGNLYKRPIAVFYLPEIPKTFEPIKDFRTLKNAELSPISHNVLLEVRRAYHRREIALEIAEYLDESIKPFAEETNLNFDPIALGEKIRTFLGIDMQIQTSWKSKHEALKKWLSFYESKGILIFQTHKTSRIDLTEMRGFSLFESKYPVIVLNSKDSPAGKIFTLAHELVHLMLHKGGLCDFDISEAREDRYEDIFEIFSNRIAGEVLLPTKALLEYPVGKGRSTNDWPDEVIFEVAKYFSVSNEVVLRRLLINNFIDEQFYRRKRQEYLDEYLQYEKNRKTSNAELRIPQFRYVLRSNGEMYTRMVFNAYHSNKITTSQLTDYLGTKTSHLARIEGALIP